MSRSALIDKAIRLSQQILEAAQENAWPYLAELEIDRERTLQSYYHNNSHIDAHKTRQLKTLNDAIIVQIQAAQKQTRDMQLQLKHGGKASRAYLVNAAK